METVSNFSLEVVCSACETLKRRPQSFPPSAGELHDACLMIVENERKRREFDGRVPQPRLPPPSRQGWTHGELADWSCIINGKGGHYVSRTGKDGNDLTIPQGYPGAGKPAFYGYLTPKEADAVKRAVRAAPCPTPRPYSEAAE